jgi:hypothetical protein
MAQSASLAYAMVALSYLHQVVAALVVINASWLPGEYLEKICISVPLPPSSNKQSHSEPQWAITLPVDLPSYSTGISDRVS